MAKTASLLKQTEVPEPRRDQDTIRLWEGYRDQALMWRALALLQIPATFIAVMFALTMWITRSITLNVPARPLPGQYSAEEIPDEEFIEAATEYINLITTYQPANARKQFNKAREYVDATMIERFDSELLDKELKAIETTYRTQVYFIDPTHTAVARTPYEVTVHFEGDRLKTVASKTLPEVKTRFSITMTTVPRNAVNPYGIVVSNVTFANLDEFGKEEGGQNEG